MENQTIMSFRHIKTIIYILTLLGIVVFLYIKKEDLEYLVKMHYTNTLLLFAAGIIPVSINAFLFRNNISIFNIKLSFKEWYGLTTINTMYNYLLPARGGIAVRALYMKQNFHFSYSQYISFTLGTYILALTDAAFLATILSATLYVTHHLNNIAYLYISIGLLLGITGLLILLYKFNLQKIPEKNKIWQFIKNVAMGIKQFKGKPDKVRNLILIHLGFILAIGLRLFVVYKVLDIPVSFTKLVFINSLVAFSMLFSATPGNIGIKEGIIGLSSSLLGISFDQALLGAILDRVVEMIVVFGFGAVFSRILLKKIRPVKYSFNKGPL